MAEAFTDEENDLKKHIEYIDQQAKMCEVNPSLAFIEQLRRRTYFLLYDDNSPITARDKRIEELEIVNRELELRLINLGKQYRELSKHPDNADQTAEIERLRGEMQKIYKKTKRIIGPPSDGPYDFDSDCKVCVAVEEIVSQALDVGKEK